ncbi:MULTISPECIES: hypothetical protein [Acinetobacter]|uniref:hypothetical protein n=1 Tax=Acinetobacter TaxID=469 RepID=UPI001023382F|nr:MULTISPECIES: hypothetical protein [Acinetobacter]RZH47497.1 hypothetical protein EXD89_05150 [Acinetobacter pittii]
MPQGLQILDENELIVLDFTDRSVNMFTTFYIDMYLTNQVGWGAGFDPNTPAKVTGTFSHPSLNLGQAIFIPIATGKDDPNIQVKHMITGAVLNKNNVYGEYSPQRPDFIVNGGTVTWSFNMNGSAYTGDYGDFIVGGFLVHVGFF